MHILQSPHSPDHSRQQWSNENHLKNLLPPITNLSISSDSITTKSEYCASNITEVSITEHLFSKPVTENRFIFHTPNQACHDTQKEQIARYNKGKPNPGTQQQSLQAFAQETDCSPSKNFNSGSQYPTQFPKNANSCPQPTKNQSSVVAENIQLQNPQYTYATHAEQVSQQKMLFSLLNNRILNCFSSLITICFHKTTISFLIKLLCNFHHFLLSVTLRNKQTNNLYLNFAHNQHFCLTICKIIKVKLPLSVQHLQCPPVQMYQISLIHRQKATQNKILSPKQWAKQFNCEQLTRKCIVC